MVYLWPARATWRLKITQSSRRLSDRLLPAHHRYPDLSGKRPDSTTRAETLAPAPRWKEPGRRWSRPAGGGSQRRQLDCSLGSRLVVSPLNSKNQSSLLFSTPAAVPPFRLSAAPPSVR